MVPTLAEITTVVPAVSVPSLPLWIHWSILLSLNSHGNEQLPVIINKSVDIDQWNILLTAHICCYNFSDSTKKENISRRKVSIFYPYLEWTANRPRGTLMDSHSNRVGSIIFALGISIHRWFKGETKWNQDPPFKVPLMYVQYGYISLFW